MSYLSKTNGSHGINNSELCCPPFRPERRDKKAIINMKHVDKGGRPPKWYFAPFLGEALPLPSLNQQ